MAALRATPAIECVPDPRLKLFDRVSRRLLTREEGAVDLRYHRRFLRAQRHQHRNTNTVRVHRPSDGRHGRVRIRYECFAGLGTRGRRAPVLQPGSGRCGSRHHRPCTASPSTHLLRRHLVLSILRLEDSLEYSPRDDRLFPRERNRILRAA
eukprot:SAG25_NODE_497_length_7401_cov_6.170227_7_plen_152_part_00